MQYKAVLTSRSDDAVRAGCGYQTVTRAVRACVDNAPEVRRSDCTQTNVAGKYTTAAGRTRSLAAAAAAAAMST